jgi:hypothetical protein
MSDPIKDVMVMLNNLNRLYHKFQLDEADAVTYSPEALEEMAVESPNIAYFVAQQEADEAARAALIMRDEPVVFDEAGAQALVDYATTHVYGALMAAGYEDSQDNWSLASGYALNNMFLGITIDQEDGPLRSPLQNLENEFPEAFNRPWKETAFTALSGYQNVVLYDPAKFLPEHWVVEAVRQGEIRGDVPKGTGARLKLVTGARGELGRYEAGTVPDVWYEARDEDLARYIDVLWQNIPELMLNETVAGTRAQRFVTGGVAGLFSREADKETESKVKAGQAIWKGFGVDPDLEEQRRRKARVLAGFGNGSLTKKDTIDRVISGWLTTHKIPLNTTAIPKTPDDLYRQGAVRTEKNEVIAEANYLLDTLAADGEVDEDDRNTFMDWIDTRMNAKFLENVEARITVAQNTNAWEEAKKFAEDMQTESKRAAFIKEQIKRLVTEEGGRSISNDQVDDLVDSADIEGWANLLLGVGSQAAAEELFRADVLPKIEPALRNYYDQQRRAAVADALPETEDEAAELAYNALSGELEDAGVTWGQLDAGLRGDLAEFVLEHGGLSDAARPGAFISEDEPLPPEPSVLDEFLALARPGIELAQTEFAFFDERGQAIAQIQAALAETATATGVSFNQLPGELQNQLIETVMAMGGDLFDPQIDPGTRQRALEGLVDHARVGMDEIVAERELGAARAGVVESFRDAFQARHPNLIRTEEQLAYFDDVVMQDFGRRYRLANMQGELDTAGGIEEFIRTVVEGVDADQFITPAVIGPTALQQEEALTQLKVNAVVTRRNAERAAVAEAERLTGERAALEGVVPGLEVAAAGDEEFERFLLGELPGMREAYNTAYDDELAARREVLAQEQAEQITAWKVAGYEAAQDLEMGGPPSVPGAGLDAVPPDLTTQLETTQSYAQDPALYAAIHEQYKADLERAELEAREARPSWEEYVAGQIPGLRARRTREQEEREALFAPPGSETRRIMDERQAQAEAQADESRLAREQYDREAAQERRQRTLTRAVPGVRVQRTRARY